jgi:hypothetical protein
VTNNLQNYGPRFRGKVGQIETSDDPSDIGKWVATLWMVAFGEPETDENRLGMFGPYATKEEAHVALGKVTEAAVREFERQYIGKDSGQYIDMKTNEVRRWDRKDEV